MKYIAGQCTYRYNTCHYMKAVNSGTVPNTIVRMLRNRVRVLLVPL